METIMDFPGGSEGKSICLQYGRPGFDPWVRKIPCRRKWQPTPVLLPGKSHGQRSLVGYSPWGHKETRLSDFTFTFSTNEVATIPFPIYIPCLPQPLICFQKIFAHIVGHTVFNNWTILSSILSSSHLLNIKILRAGVGFYIVSLINHRTKNIDRCRKSTWKSFLMIMWFICIAIQMIQEAL